MPGEIHHVGFVIMSRMSWGMYGHYIVSPTLVLESSITLTEPAASDTFVFHLDLLVRYSSCMGRSSRQPHARCHVAFVEELAKQVPRQHPHHPSGLYRCLAVVLRLCPVSLAIPARKATKAIHLFLGGFRGYPYWSTRLGRLKCWRWWALVQNTEYGRGHVVLHDAGYHVYSIFVGCWYHRTI